MLVTIHSNVEKRFARLGDGGWTIMTTNHPVPTPPPSEPAPSLRPVEEIDLAALVRRVQSLPTAAAEFCAGEFIAPLLARLRAAEETLAAVGALAEEWRAYQQTGFYPEASAHANAIENCGDALADLLADRAALAEGASR